MNCRIAICSLALLIASFGFADFTGSRNVSLKRMELEFTPPDPLPMLSANNSEWIGNEKRESFERRVTRARIVQAFPELLQRVPNAAEYESVWSGHQPSTAMPGPWPFSISAWDDVDHNVVEFTIELPETALTPSNITPGPGAATPSVLIIPPVFVPNNNDFRSLDIKLDVTKPIDPTPNGK